MVNTLGDVDAEREWTNSVFGRFLGTATGLAVIVIAFVVHPDPSTPPESTRREVMTSVSGIERETKKLVAVNVPRQGRPVHVHRHGIRTLISGRTWDELWTTRAEKIEREILSLAKASRGETAD